MRSRFALAALLALAAPVSADDAEERFFLEADQHLTGDSPFGMTITFRLRPNDPMEMLDAQGGDQHWLDSIARWQLQIYDFDDHKVDFRQGRAAPAGDAFAWSGVTQAGDLLRDGFYRAVFAWADLEGRRHRTAPIQVAVLTPPGLREIVGAQVRLAVGDDGLVFRLSQDLTFAPGRWQVRPDTLPTLEKIADFLKRYPDNRIAVEGHADPTGDERLNRLLSRQRARAVHDFLVERGLDPTQVTFEGLGSSHPIAANTSDAGRARNRRVEIVLRRAEI